MDERVVELYRTRGGAVFARCRRLLGDDDAAAAATARVFTRVQDRLDDAAAVGAVIREVCAQKRRLLLVPAEPEPSAAELAAAEARFERDVFRRTLPLVLRDQQAPPILRWVFIYAPILVCLAVVGMFLAARSRRHREGEAGVEVYRERSGLATRLASGDHVRHGDRLRVIVVPGGYRYATVFANARVLARLGPIDRDETRLPLEPLTVEDEGTLRVTADFGPSPKGLPAIEVAVIVAVD